MDLATKLSVVALGLILAGVIWWVVSSGSREHRRAKAERWARRQVTSTDTVPLPSGGKHGGRHDAAGNPLRLKRPEDGYDDAAVLVRPYVQDEFPTAVLPIVGPDDDAGVETL